MTSLITSFVYTYSCKSDVIFTMSSKNNVIFKLSVFSNYLRSKDSFTFSESFLAKCLQTLRVICALALLKTGPV